jgi:hypothetical protein
MGELYKAQPLVRHTRELYQQVVAEIMKILEKS